jgi:transcriptional regulator with XRE-family HTH domain
MQTENTIKNECLESEVARLGLTQSFIASSCGVQRQTVGRWMKGDAIASDKLAVLADIGFDIYYIVTGVRKSSPDPKLAAMAALMEGLSEEQQREIRAAVAEKKRLNELSQRLLDLEKTLKKAG